MVRLHLDLRAKLFEAVLSLENDPLRDGHRIKKRVGTKGRLHRLRHGEFRILFEISGSTVYVLDVVRPQRSRAVGEALRALTSQPAEHPVARDLPDLHEVREHLAAPQL